MADSSDTPIVAPSRIGNQKETPRYTALAALFGIGIFSLLALVVPGAILELDGQNMIGVTRSIIEHGDVSLGVSGPGVSIGVPGRGGILYSKYGPGQSVIAVPFYTVGRTLEPLVPAAYRPEIPVFAASLLPACATAVTAAFLLLAAIQLGASVRSSVLLAVIYTSATPAIVYATQWFSEPLTTCALMISVYFVLRSRSSSAWSSLAAGTAIALAVATRLDAVLFVPPLLFYVLLIPEKPIKRVVFFLSPIALALVGLGFYNGARFGSPYETGYSKGNIFDRRDTHPEHSVRSFIAGLYGLLLSPGKGIIEYAPVSLLVPYGACLLWARRRAETLLLVSLCLIDLVAHANILIRWVGGWSWGPRFLLPILPLAILLLAPVLTHHVLRKAILGLACIGVIIQVPAVLIHEPHTYLYGLEPRYCHSAVLAQCSRSDTERLENDYINNPALSPVIGSLLALGDGRTWRSDTLLSPDRIISRSVTVAPHTWWRLLALQGVSPAPLIVMCLLLSLVALIGFYRAWVLVTEARPVI